MTFVSIEKQLEDEEALEKNLNQEKKKTFADEDAYDSEEERKKKQEEEKKQQTQTAAAGTTKKKAGAKKDYDKLFEERLNSNKSSNVQRTLEEGQTKGLSKDARGELLSRAAEDDITESLFGDLNTTAKSLVTEKDYQNFGKKVAGVLYQGQAPYRIPSFFKEALRDIQKELDSKKIKDILDNVTTLYNEKVKEEKEKDKGGKAKPKKTAQLASGKNTRDAQIINQMIGDDDYDDEDDYGEEGYTAAAGKGGARKKVEEADYDFM